MNAIAPAIGPASAQALLRVQSLRKSFGNLDVLKGISFDLQRGETPGVGDLLSFALGRGSTRLARTMRESRLAATAAKRGSRPMSEAMKAEREASSRVGGLQGSETPPGPGEICPNSLLNKNSTFCLRAQRSRWRFQGERSFRTQDRPVRPQWEGWAASSESRTFCRG